MDITNHKISVFTRQPTAHTTFLKSKSGNEERVLFTRKRQRPTVKQLRCIAIVSCHFHHCQANANDSGDDEVM